MNKIGLIFILVFIFGGFWVDVSLPQLSQNQDGATESIIFLHAESENNPIPKYFEVSVREIYFKISNTGKILDSSPEPLGDKNIIPLLKYEVIDWIRYGVYKNDIILIYGISDGESAGGVVSRLDGKTFLARWRTQIPTFNIGPGLAVNDRLYFTAGGMVAKVDLESGEYLWKHRNLSRSSGFYRSFLKPELEGHDVLFPENNLYNLGRKPLVLRVEDETGKILEGLPPKK